MEDGMKDKLLIVIHIPKAGGETLRQIVRRQFRDKNFFSLNGIEGGLVTKTEYVKNFPQAEKDDIRCIMGHMPFGLHQYFSRPCEYITMLRHPIQRVISLYYYILRNPIHPLHNTILSSHITLEDFVQSQIDPGIENEQVRLISGINALESLGGKVLTDNHLIAAKKNIDGYFPAVGLTERFDDSVLLFAKIFRWKYIFYRKQNINRYAKREVSSSVIQAIEKRNLLDLELYDYAKNKFEENLKMHEVSLSKCKLGLFRLFNNFYGKTVMAKRSLRSLLKKLI